MAAVRSTAPSLAPRYSMCGLNETSNLIKLSVIFLHRGTPESCLVSFTCT